MAPLGPFFTPADLEGPAAGVFEGPAVAEAGFRPFGGIVKSQVLVQGCVRGGRELCEREIRSGKPRARTGDLFWKWFNWQLKFAEMVLFYPICVEAVNDGADVLVSTRICPEMQLQDPSLIKTFSEKSASRQPVRRIEGAG